MNRKLVIVVLIVVAIAAAVLAARWFREEPKDRILITGNIELTQVDIAFKVPGKLMELNVKEGAPVQKGQVIARLDRGQMEGQLDRDRAGVTAAESQLAQLETGIRYQRETIANETALRRAELRQAEAALQELLAGARSQEVQQAQAGVAEAAAQHQQAAQDLKRAEKLFRDDDISAAQRDQARTRSDTTAAALRASEERLALVKEGARREDIEAGRAVVERARAAVRLAEANRIELERRQQEVTARRAEIQRARAQVAIVQSQIEDTVAIAPISATVLVKSVEPGEVLPAGTTLCTLGDLDHPWLRGYIDERDLGRVKLGMTARIATDSFPGKTYHGRVSFISSEAEFTPKQIQTREERVKLVYRIKIDAENPNHELKLNMPVEAELLLNQP